LARDTSKHVHGPEHLRNTPRADEFERPELAGYRCIPLHVGV
jgi:hypothetical protein